MKKRPKLEKRQRQKLGRVVHRDRVMPARVWRVHPEPGRPHIVEVRIARSRRAMRDEMRRIDDAKGEDLNVGCMGLVRHWHHTRGRRHTRCLAGYLLVRMYLNVPDLRDYPAEIVGHECTHAGMAWARLRRADLNVMAGEEVLAYAVGRLTEQVNRVAHAMGVWR